MDPSLNNDPADDLFLLEQFLVQVAVRLHNETGESKHVHASVCIWENSKCLHWYHCQKITQQATPLVTVSPAIKKFCDDESTYLDRCCYTPALEQ